MSSDLQGKGPRFSVAAAWCFGLAGGSRAPAPHSSWSPSHPPEMRPLFSPACQPTERAWVYKSPHTCKWTLPFRVWHLEYSAGGYLVLQILLSKSTTEGLIAIRMLEIELSGVRDHRMVTSPVLTLAALDAV